MALNDILQAIADEANGRISTAKSEHDAAMRDLKSAHTKTLTERVGRIRQITETRKQTLRSHAENQATMIARHAIVERISLRAMGRGGEISSECPTSVR
jgi:hypothetical protein